MPGYPPIYKTWGQFNDDPDIKQDKSQQNSGEKPKPKPKSDVTIELKDTNHLKFAIKNTRIVIVKASAEWCAPCQTLAPKYQDLARQHQNNPHFTFYTDDIDNENSPHAKIVSAVPSFFLYADGSTEPKKQFTGDFEQLEQLVNKLAQRLSMEGNEEQQQQVQEEPMQ